MNHYCHILELHKILEMLAGHAVSEDCKARCVSLEPFTTFAEASAQMRKTDDTFTLSSKFGTPSFSRIRSVTGSLKRAAAGGTLPLRELLAVAHVLRQIRVLTEWHKQCESMETSLTPLFSALCPNKYLEERILDSILSEEEVADSASSELAAIRRKITAAGLRAREQLDKLVRSQSTQKYLQDGIVTMRDGRYVVPVKAEHRGDVPGLVHDTSSSGSTLFVEPMAVVEANNEIRVLRAKEKAEIERIIAELSAECGMYAESTLLSYELCTELELYFAKSNLGAKMRGCIPKLTQNGIVRLRKARHPLIASDAVVPIDVTLGEQYASLIVTGPNTGGKTVTLKTVGLLTVMAMCGLMLPAADGSEISVFDDVLADIGDEQSIEQSLSTFSAHMNNIIRILDKAGERSLVLIDELGSGTDPVEGAALAIAILDELRAKGCRVMASTHYQEIKIYALQTENVENACCEFDVETLRPTYRLLVGVPGKSNAFAIATRLGMPENIVRVAKQHIDDDTRIFERTIEALEHSRAEMEAHTARLSDERREAAALTAELKEQHRALEAVKAKAMEQARGQAMRIVEEVRAQSQLLMDELDQLRREKDQENFSALASTAKSRLKGKLDRMYDTANPVQERTSLPDQGSRPLKKGDPVVVTATGMRGVLTTEPDESGTVYVQLGSMRVKTTIRELSLSDAPEQPGKKLRRTHASSRGVKSKAERDLQLELDIRGQTVDEGLLELDQFIDNAVMSGVGFVTIIHGKGTGALRSAVQQHLKQHRSVRTFRLGVYGEGESGVTVAELQ